MKMLKLLLHEQRITQCNSMIQNSFWKSQDDIQSNDYSTQ